LIAPRRVRDHRRMASPANMPMPRPSAVPAEARWDPKDVGFEWVVGTLDDAGERDGHYKSWNRDGLLHGECDYVHGKLVGKNINYHPDGTVASVGDYIDGKCRDCLFYRSEHPTTEPFGSGEKNVWSIGYYSRDGKTNYTIRYFTRGGTEVGPDGEPLPARPAGVVDSARWFPDLERWVDGEIERGTNHQVGHWRWWAVDGVLRHEEQRDAQGEATTMIDYEDDGALDEKTVIGDDGIKQRDVYFDNGALSLRYRDDAKGRRIYKGSWYKDGSLDEEETSVYDGDVLVSVTEKGEDGALVFEARREGPVMACVLYHDDGKTIAATGALADGKLHGVWRIADETGAVRREIDTSPLAIKHKPTGEGLQYRLGLAAFRLDEPKLETPEQLRGVDDVAWDKCQGPYNDDIEKFPRYLRALVSPDPFVRTFAMGQIDNEIAHQGSVYSATAAVMPWFGRLLTHPNADKLELLASMQLAGNNSSAYLGEVQDLDEDDDDRIAIEGTYKAVAAAWPLIWAQYGGVSDVGKQMILVLAKFAPEAKAMVIEAARRDPKPALRCCAIDSLTDFPDFTDDEVLPCLDDPEPLVRCSAAIALALSRGPNTPAAVVPALAEALRTWRDLAAEWNDLAYTNGHLVASVSLSLGSIRSPAARALAKPLCASIDDVDGVSATAYGQGLLALAFGRGERPFADDFIEILETLAKSKRFWAFNVNANEVLDRWNLRGGFGEDAKALVDLVAELRRAPDPEAAMYERMHADDSDDEEDDDEEDDDDDEDDDEED
jgi:antitoxin component YwqK of YwqJK toxin-antitoxin module